MGGISSSISPPRSEIIQDASGRVSLSHRSSTYSTDTLSNSPSLSSPISLGMARRSVLISQSDSKPNKATEPRPIQNDTKPISNLDARSDSIGSLVDGFQELTFASPSNTAPPSTNFRTSMSTDPNTDSMSPRTTVGSRDSYMAETSIGSSLNNREAASDNSLLFSSLPSATSSTLHSGNASLNSGSSFPSTTSPSTTSTSMSETGSPLIRWRSRHQPSYRNLFTSPPPTEQKSPIELVQDLAVQLSIPLIIAPEIQESAASILADILNPPQSPSPNQESSISPSTSPRANSNLSTSPSQSGESLLLGRASESNSPPSFSSTATVGSVTSASPAGSPPNPSLVASSNVIAFFEQLACSYQPAWFKQTIQSYKKLGMDISIPDKKVMGFIDVWRQYYQKGSDYVTSLTLCDMGLKSALPSFILNLTNLQSVVLSHNQLTETHIKSLFQLTQLVMLNLKGNQIKKLPGDIGRFSELVELDLSFNQLEVLPVEIENCVSLAKLDIQSNQILALPFGLAKLPLVALDIRDNPLSALPPKARVDAKSVWEYLGQSLNGGTERWTRLRLMVVGPENVGKTRLVRRLTRKEYLPLSTDGIEVETFKLKINKSKIVDGKLHQFDIRVYDFGGQEVFYPTHSFFIAPRSVYIATFKMAADIDSINWSSLEYWLRTIKLLGGSEQAKPSVIVVGTHLDEFEAKVTGDGKDILNAITRRIQLLDSLVHIRNIIFISNKNKKGLDQLRLAILKRAEKEDAMRTPISISWAAMDSFLTSLIEKNTIVAPTTSVQPKENPPLTSPKDQITKSSSKDNFTPPKASSSPFTILFSSHANNQPIVSSSSSLRFISWTQFQEYAAMFNVVGDSVVAEMAQFLHDMGTILWYNSTLMREVVILDPQWLSEVMACIISMKVRWKDGELPHAALANIWKAYPVELHHTLLSFLEHFEVAYPLKGTDKTIIPCMFNDEPSDAFKSEMALINTNAEKSPKYMRKYRFKGFLPLGFFDRMIVRIMHIEGVKLTSSWRYGIIMRMGPATGMVTFDSLKKILLVTVLSRGNSDILFPSILESIESLIRTSYRNVKVTRKVVTTLVSPLQPDEFDYDSVLDAFYRGERNFFCGKVALPIEDIAPDISMNFIPELKKVKVNEAIGRGGFGIVYKGRWNGVDVAIKEVDFKTALASANTEAFRQFAHEVWMMSKLSHPNLVHLYGITLHPLRMVMEYCPGMDLNRFLSNNPKVPFDSSYALLRFRIAIDVAKGMQHLHNLSPPVIHRDLRSPNVFVVSSDDNAETVAKIGDFGLAEFTAHNLNEALPTWQWLPPETFNALGNFKYNEKCDRYSFGIVLWEIFTGKEPFSEYFDDPRFVISPNNSSTNTATTTSPRTENNFLSLSNASDALSSLQASSHSSSQSSLALSGSIQINKPSDTSPQQQQTSPRQIPTIQASLATSPPVERPQIQQLSLSNLQVPSQSGSSPRKTSRDGSSYQNCNIQNLKTAISSQGLRPTIPPHVPHRVKQLILRCWDSNPAKRPDFAEILSVLVTQATEAGLETLAPPQNRSVTIWRSTVASQRSTYYRQPITKSIHSSIPLESGVLCMAYNPKNTEIWSGCSDGNVRIFNCKTRVRNVEVHPVSNGSSHARIHQLLYTKCDNPRIWSCSDRIVVWNPESRLLEKELFQPHANIVRSMLFIEARNQVWTADVDGLVCVWDANNFSLLHTIRLVDLVNTPVFCMCLVNGTSVWLGCNSKIVVIDINTLQATDQWEAHKGYRIMAMVVAGNQVWTGSELRICIWDKTSHQPVTDPTTGSKLERMVEFGVVSMISVKRPNDVVHVWSGDSNGSVTVWNTDLSKPAEPIYQILNNHKKDSIHAILDIDDGNTICSGSYGNPNSKTKDNSICLWQYE